MLVFIYSNSSAQWQTAWSSTQIPDGVVAGWFSFEKVNNAWKGRMYAVDSLKFQVMNSSFSSTPEYTYTFNAAEQFAGGQIYSLEYDLTGDGKVEFYVLGYYGTSTNYRTSFKIINIVNGATVFEKNDLNFSYSYPIISDLDGNGTLECLVTKYDFPYANKYFFDIYSTGVTGVQDENKPIKFTLNQNFPNPFNPSTTISYSLDKSQNVQLRIFDLQGKLIKNLVSEFQLGGNYNAKWDGTNDGNSKQPSGIYFYELKIGDGRFSKKMLMLK